LLPGHACAGSKLIELPETGETIDDSLTLYPSVTRQQALAVLRFANDRLIECLSS
jgi:uncharacterized protein (DUF433 family)